MLQYFRLIGLALLLSVGFGNVGKAASFDCAKAATETEKAICSDFQLSVDDRILAHLYKKHLAWRKGRDAWFAGDAQELPVESIRENQNNWLKNERDLCGNKIACLRSALDSRIDYFFENVRLEKPRTGTNHQVYIRSIQNSKNALRLIAAMLENVERFGLLPKIEGGNQSYFGEYHPVFYEHERDVWTQMTKGKGKQISGHIFSENTLKLEQVGFGDLIQVNYGNLNDCLLKSTLDDFNWGGNWVYLSSEASSNCISFFWPSDYLADNHMNSGEPGEYINFPLVKSEFIGPDTTKMLEEMRVCADLSFDKLCANSLISKFDKDLFQVNSEYMLSSFATPLNAYNLFLTLKKEIKDCTDDICVEIALLSQIRGITKLIQDKGIVPKSFAFCDFKEDGIYQCGDSKICMANNSVFQLSKITDEKYQLDFWENYDDYDPLNYGHNPTKTFVGISYLSGTYPCTHKVYSFGEAGLVFGNPGCTDNSPVPVGNMFSLFCDDNNPYCKTNDYCVSAN